MASRPRPLTAMQRGMSDIISYEDILIAQYMNDIEKSPPTRISKGDVAVSPYTLASQSSDQIRSRRPKSAIATHHRRKELEATKTAMEQDRVPFMAWDGDEGDVYLKVPKNKPKKRPSTASSTRSRNSSFSSAASSLYGTRTSRSYSQGSVSGGRGKRSKPLYKKQPKVICIRAFQNGNRDNFARVTAPNMLQLLDACTAKLGLISAARKLFFSDGSPVVDTRQIERDADIYVSCGEPFRDPYAAMREKEDLRQSASWTLSGIILPENKGRGKTKTSLSKRMSTLVESQRRRILVFRNGENSEGVEIVAGRFDEFLDDSTAKLKLESGARKLFDWEGNEIKSFSDVPVLDRILQPSTTTVLGPVWVTKGGERFSPKGSYNFLLTLLKNTKERLKYSKAFKEQLELQMKRSDEVLSKEIMSMTDEEVYQEISEVDEHVSELSAVVPMLKKQMKTLQESFDDENAMGSYKYKHISEISPDNRLLGSQQGFRLKVFENGRVDGEVIIYFNPDEEKGLRENAAELRNRFLDKCAIARQNSGPAGRRIAKRIFLRDGSEVKLLNELANETEIWLSYGEEFKPLTVMVLQLNLDKATCMSLWDEVEFIQREPMMDDEKGSDRITSWKAIIGFPPSSKRQLVNHEMPEPQRLGYAQGLQKSRVDEKGCFLQHREKKNMVLYPEVGASEKEKKGSGLWPVGAQEWVITQDGLIFSKAMPQLALAKSETGVQAKFDDESFAGFALQLKKRSPKDPSQQWGFSPTGQIYSLAKPSLFLTYVAKQEITVTNPDKPVNGEQETGLTGLQFVDMPSGDNEQPSGLTDLKAEYGGQRYDIVLLSKLSGKSHITGSQRWAIKQEDLSSVGQWKYSAVSNPEWNKKALSWPVTEDGNWNTKFSWPMEGFLLPFAPPVKRHSDKKTNQPGSACRLRVLKNGDSDESQAVIVVGPDLTNMWHDVSPNSKKTKGRTQEKASQGDQSQGDSCHPLDLKKIELQLFLDQCTGALGLPFAARKLFNDEGQEINCISDLARDQLVYVSCGEAWVDPQMSYSEQQRRALLMNLASDIARIRQYCALREPQDLVLHVSGSAQAGASIVVETCVLSSLEREKLINKTADQDEEDDEEPLPIAELSHAITAHERSHQRSEERLKTLRYSWENDKTSKGHQESWEDKDDDFDNEVSFSDPQLQLKFRRQSYKTGDNRQSQDPSNRQKWFYSDGFIHLKKNPQLVLGLQEGLDSTASNEVILCKKKVEDPSQRWIISEDGTICLRSNVQLVLTVTTPPLGNDPFSYDPSLECGFNGSAVIVASRKVFANGHAHQLWSFNRLTGFIEAFAADSTNREITSANKSNVCTYAVLGPKEVHQPGYVYMQGTSRQKLLCEACGKASRGRNKLQRLKESKTFSCTLGSGTSEGKFTGCFKCLNSKVDLSSLEAESTLELWEYQLDRLRNEGSARTIAKELNVAKSVAAVRIMAYKNGEGSRGQGVLVIGSSIHSLLDQATTRLGLTQAARRMYTVRGELITDIHQLIRPYSVTMETSPEANETKAKSPIKSKARGESAAISNGHAVDYIEAENRRHYDHPDNLQIESLDLNGLDGQGDEEEAGNETFRLSKGRARKSLPTVKSEGFPEWDTRWPIDVWVSCGEPFVPLEEADKQYLLSMKHREERTWVQAYLDMEKHVLRHMQGRRLAGSIPGQPNGHVVQSWAEPTLKEESKEVTITQLKMHLDDVKSRQKDESLMLTKGAKESTQRLYTTPKTLRVRVYPNGETTERSVVVFGASVREILDHSTSRLDLNSAARRLFKSDGQEVFEMEDLKRDDVLCVSCGDNFMRARDRRHQMELKATWSRLSRQSGTLPGSGPVSTQMTSHQLSLPAPSSPPPPSRGLRHGEGSIEVHKLRSTR